MLAPKSCLSSSAAPAKAGTSSLTPIGRPHGSRFTPERGFASDCGSRPSVVPRLSATRVQARPIFSALGAAPHPSVVPHLQQKAPDFRCLFHIEMQQAKRALRPGTLSRQCSATAVVTTVRSTARLHRGYDDGPSNGGQRAAKAPWPQLTPTASNATPWLDEYFTVPASRKILAPSPIARQCRRHDSAHFDGGRRPAKAPWPQPTPSRIEATCTAPGHPHKRQGSHSKNGNAAKITPNPQIGPLLVKSLTPG